MTDWAAYAAGLQALRALPPEVMRAWMERVGRTADRAPEDLPAGPWLDAGAGVGRFCAVLGAYWQRAVVALEPQAMMVAQGPRAAGVWWVRGSATAPPLPPESCAGVWVHLVLHQIPDWPRAVEQLAACVAPGGLLAIRTMNPTGDVSDLVYEFFPDLSALQHRWPAPAAIAEAVAGTGLGVIVRDYREVRVIPRETFISRIEGKAFSSLHHLDDTAFAEGVARMHARLPPGSPAIEQAEYSALIVGIR